MQTHLSILSAKVNCIHSIAGSFFDYPFLFSKVLTYFPFIWTFTSKCRLLYLSPFYVFPLASFLWSPPRGGPWSLNCLFYVFTTDYDLLTSTQAWYPFSLSFVAFFANCFLFSPCDLISSRLCYVHGYGLLSLQEDPFKEKTPTYVGHNCKYVPYRGR